MPNLLAMWLLDPTQKHTIDWVQHNFYAFPPFSLMALVVKRMLSRGHLCSAKLANTGVVSQSNEDGKSKNTVLLKSSVHVVRYQVKHCSPTHFAESYLF